MEISVYITSYNQKDLLEEAIESVLTQTLRPHQIIIVDDASQDGSQEMINAFVRKYPEWITPVFHNENRGVAATRNSALTQVTGDYVTYIDGDDHFLPKKLEHEAQTLLNNKQVQIAFSNVFIINQQGNRIDVWVKDTKPPEGNVFAHTFARAFPRNHLFRNELVNFAAWKQSDVGWYDPNLRVYEDYDMRVRLTHTLLTAYVDEPLSEYRRHQDSLRTSNPREFLKAFEYILDKNEHLLNNLAPPVLKWANRRLDSWHAELWRRVALHDLLEEGTWWHTYRNAWESIVMAWHYEKRLPLPFLLRFLTPINFYLILQKNVHKLRARNIPQSKNCDDILR